MYCLSGQTTVLITSIAVGIAGLSLEILKDLDPLVPQPFVAVTLIVPLVNPAGYLNEILLVPWPVTFIAFAGTAHAYELTPAAAPTE